MVLARHVLLPSVHLEVQHVESDLSDIVTVGSDHDGHLLRHLGPGHGRVVGVGEVTDPPPQLLHLVPPVRPEDAAPAEALGTVPSGLPLEVRALSAGVTNSWTQNSGTVSVLLHLTHHVVVSDVAGSVGELDDVEDRDLQHPLLPLREVESEGAGPEQGGRHQQLHPVHRAETEWLLRPRMGYHLLCVGPPSTRVIY